MIYVRVCGLQKRLAAGKAIFLHMYVCIGTYLRPFIHDVCSGLRTAETARVWQSNIYTYTYICLYICMYIYDHLYMMHAQVSAPQKQLEASQAIYIHTYIHTYT
jgi:hypothetical protein